MYWPQLWYTGPNHDGPIGERGRNYRIEYKIIVFIHEDFTVRLENNFKRTYIIINRY